ncbi:MAG: hypothetical protein ABIR39_01575 [Nocardioides sp.]|uniref:hypothetical protein n=1 Tax=Nocardioides sp. TaxID=35761 RepID=UPI003264908B
MTSPSDKPVQGPAAAGIVANDPFWSVVRRRHPDIDIVVLPPDEAPDLTPAPGAEPIHTGAARTDFEADVADLWDRLGQPEERSSVRWTTAPNRGAVALEGRITAEDVDPDEAAATLRRAAERLADAGWHVLVPPDGLPRLSAGQVRSTGRRTVQLVHVPDLARLTLIVRSEPIPVSRNTAATLLGGAR